MSSKNEKNNLTKSFKGVVVDVFKVGFKAKKIYNVGDVFTTNSKHVYNNLLNSKKIKKWEA